MKLLPFLVVVLFASALRAQPSPLQSGVYKWVSPADKASISPSSTEILAGSTTALANLRVRAYALDSGESLNTGDDSEMLVIVKAGLMTLKIGGKQQTIGPGSVAVIMPGDDYDISNEGNTALMYYTFQYKARTPVKADQPTRHSYVVDWKELEMKRNERGGRRDFFDHATSMFSRFEMHVTTLNEGLQSHPPHTHKAEEFLLVIEGDVEEQINDSFNPAAVGDLIFVDSLVPHTIKNVGKGAATYFAFQWE